MSLSRFDQWYITEPEYFPTPVLHCDECGAFLSREPESHRDQVTLEPCRGSIDASYSECGNTNPHIPHLYVAHYWMEYFRTCKKCNRVNKEVDY